MNFMYKVEYKNVNNRAVIYIFSRDENRTKCINFIDNFYPYFYINEDADILDNRVIKVEKGYTNLFNNPVKKVICQHPKYVPELRQMFKETWEDDLVFELRFLIDNFEKLKEKGFLWIGEGVEFRKCYIDIETTTEFGFPDIRNPKNNITAITIYDNYDKLYHTFVWRQDLKLETMKKDDKVVYTFDNERAMLSSFLALYQKLSPDVILGWNVYFDLPYLTNRLDVIGLKKEVLSPIGKVYNRESKMKTSDRVYYETLIGGVAIVDLLHVYRQTHKGELRSYSLRNVGIEELDIDKGIVNAEDEWKKSDIKDLVKYNATDVEIIVKLDEKRKLFNFISGICNVSGCNIEDVKYYSRVIDCLVLRYAKTHNVILPSKRKMMESSKYEGGYVFAKPGLYENVISLDFTTLYPNIIKSFNLSLETLKEDGEIDAIKTRVIGDIKGIMPSIIDDLLNLRKSYKKKQLEVEFGGKDYYIYDAIQQAAKNLYCTVYGVNALPTFRMFDSRIADSITSIGRELIQQTSKIIEAEGHKVIQVDTDSNYIELTKKFRTLDEILHEAERLVKLLNEFYNKWCLEHHAINPTINIKFEKVYKRFLTVTKKRWAGYLLWREGKTENGIDIAGLTTRRSDCSNFTKAFQKQFLNMLLKEGNKEDVIKYIKSELKKFKDFHYDFEYIGIPVKLNKPVFEYVTNIPVVRGVNWSNEHLKTTFKEGDKFLMLYCNGVQDIICYEFNQQLIDLDMKTRMNMDKMVQRSIIMPLKSIFTAVNWDLDSILTNQQSLDCFGVKPITHF